MEIVLQRDEFIEQVSSLLLQAGFIQNANIYTLEKKIHQGGQTIVINGQRMDQPGKVLTVKYEVEIVGDGCIMNVNDEVEESFTQIRISTPGGSIEEGFYWDDFEWFRTVFNKIIR